MVSNVAHIIEKTERELYIQSYAPASAKGTGQVKVITDDLDYAVVPDIQVFTINNTIIQAAQAQDKLVVR